MLIWMIVIVGDTWEEHFHRLTLLFEKLTQANLTINLKKSTFGKGTVTYLGHIVGGGNVRPKVANVEDILEYPVPKTKVPQTFSWHGILLQEVL